MNLVLWLLQGVLAVLVGAVAVPMLVTPRDDLVRRPGMGWADELTPRAIHLLGGAQLLAAVGLLLPGLLRVLPWLVPVCGFALAALFVAAVLVRRRRREPQAVPALLGLLALALVVAVGRLLLPVAS